MGEWISLTVVATAIALGAGDRAEPVTGIELHQGRHATREECALASVAVPWPAHVDALSHRGLRSRCLTRDEVQRSCFHVQVSVVRDHDRSLVVDVELEPDLGPAPDEVQQQRAAAVPSLAERGAILARWPVGAWHDLRVCLDGARVQRKSVRVPARCTLLLERHAGKPHLARLERAGEEGCIVAVNGSPYTLALGAFIPPPAEGESIRHFRFGDGTGFPGCVAPRSAVRRNYRLIGEWAGAWHVEHILVLVRALRGECSADR